MGMAFSKCVQQNKAVGTSIRLLKDVSSVIRAAVDESVVNHVFNYITRCFAVYKILFAPGEILLIRLFLNNCFDVYKQRKNFVIRWIFNRKKLTSYQTFFITNEQTLIKPQWFTDDKSHVAATQTHIYLSIGCRQLKADVAEKRSRIYQKVNELIENKNKF